METLSFDEYLSKTFTSSTSRAKPSYQRALRILDELFQVNDVFGLNGLPLKDLKDPVLVARILDFVTEEEEKFRTNRDSFFKSEISIPPSYPRDRFCKSAVRHLRDYITKISENESIALMADYKDQGKKLSKKLIGKFRLNNENTEQEAVINRRIGQDIFRAMLLNIYDCKCCLTGIDIPEVLRASHILAWSENKETRLNPENGLCLSATYDAAFDRHLISFDEDYRLILSKELKDAYSSNAFKTYFLKLEGTKIQMPSMFLPSKEFLKEHRKHLVG